MSNTRYIEINSTFRNRTLFPNPAQFIVPISQSGIRNSGLTAYDPISNAYPSYTFLGNSISRGTETFNGGTYINPVLNTNASDIDGYYNGYAITDTTLNETRQIIGYNGATQTVTLSFPFSNTWASTDTYTIQDPSVGTAVANATIQMQPDASIIDNYYINHYIYCEGLNEYLPITNYVGSTRTATLNGAFSSSWTVGETYTVRQAPPMLVDTVVSVISPTTVKINTPTGLTDNYYTGNIIYFINGLTPSQGFVITSFTASTSTITISPPLSITVNAGQSFNIIPFTRDNFSPLIYSGNYVSQQELVCYEIELISLELPNEPLVVANGSRIVFYPYVYVELTNETSTSGHNRNIIYSNNPNSIRATFIAPITDISIPITSQFIKIDSSSMMQTIKFKPNDNLRFSVFLPNGELFTTKPDNMSPLPPNPTIQINAIFSIRRL